MAMSSVLALRSKKTMDSYRIIANYYDRSYEAKPHLEDLPFYIDFANQNGGPILELGCGTGRILLPIARSGIEITGLDISEYMLAVLKEKLADETNEVKAKVTLHHGDIRSFKTEKKYALVTIPFRALQHMYSISDQIAALNSAKDSLSGNGLLIFDVFNPHFDKVYAGIGEEYLDFEWTSGDSQIKRYFRKDSIDKKNLSFTGAFIFRTYRDNQLILEEEDPIKMSFYTFPHLQLLFKIVGLEIVETFGSFKKEDLTGNSPEMIFVLRKEQK